MVDVGLEGPDGLEVAAVRFGPARKVEGSGGDVRCISTSCSSVDLPLWICSAAEVLEVSLLVWRYFHFLTVALVPKA